jgi:hypothetical protein
MPDDPAVGSVAWIEAQLRARFGPDAALGAIVFEGRRVRVEGARLPLGTAQLVLDEVVVDLGAGLPLGNLPLSAALIRLRGAVVLSPAHRVSIALATSDPRAERWFQGTLRARAELANPIEIEATLDLGPNGLSLHDGRITAGAVLAAVTADIVRRTGDTFAVDLSIVTAASRLALSLSLDPALALDGSRIGGRIAASDVLAVVQLPADLAPAAGAALDLDLTAHGPLAAPSLRGRVFAPSLVLARRSAPEAACTFDEISAVIDLDRRRLRYAELTARVHGARIAGWGRVPFAPPSGPAAAVPLAALSIQHAGAGLVSALASLAGARARVPSDLSIAGELMLRPDRSAAGAFVLATPRTELHLRIALAEGGSLVGSTLRGQLAADDAATFGIFSTPVRPRAPAVLDVDARLGGTLAKPSLAGRVGCAHAILDVSADPTHPSPLLEDVSVLLDVDGEHLAWHRFTGRFAGGSFASSGRVAFARAGGLHATLGWSGVRVEAIPTQAEGESRLAAILHGAASGELRFEHAGFEGASLSAHGQITVAEPRYWVTRTLAEPLGRFGLPRIRSRGKGPLTARVRFAGETLTVESITAAVEGVTVGGDVALARDGRLAGRVVVQLSDGYLSQSPILVIPAVMANRVSIPVELGGTVADPEIRTDALAILEGLLADNRLYDTLKTVLDGVFKASARARRTARRRRSDTE